MKNSVKPRTASHMQNVNGINIYSENSLHAQLKEYLYKPGDTLETKINGKIIDLVRASGELVEVQTTNLYKIAKKIQSMNYKYPAFRIVFPVSLETDIHRLDPHTRQTVSVRKSPKKEDIYTLLYELTRATDLILAPKVVIEVLYVKTAIVRTRDGKGSWRRKGDSTLDRVLISVLSSIAFSKKSDWLSLLPKTLPSIFTTAQLAAHLQTTAGNARLLAYCYAKAGLIQQEKSAGRAKKYKRAPKRMCKTIKTVMAKVS